jgi:hypothetical protein
MPNNPLTEQELYDYGILRSLTPPREVVGNVPPYFPAGYFLVPPHDVDGPVLWRKFHAGYIQEGIIDPNRLGTGVVGDGNLYLADDGTWKAVSSGAQDLQSVTDEGNITTNGIEVEDLHVNGDFTNYNKNLPDIGTIQTSDVRGYGLDYISEKTLAYCRIGASAFDEEGAVRIKNKVFQTYIDGAWQDVVTNFRFREDANGDYELEHKPIGFQWWIEVNSGNSDNLGLNGLPIVQNYKVSMGAYPIPLEIDGGTF